ncbi:MAG: hypothetical protein JRN09_09140, partial [Nitrososphaerota archaeon]|nr:hypothetical protein [Nitrososphaerota archaeon]
MSAPQSRLTVPTGRRAELFRNLANGRVQCVACARRCQVGEGQVGLCGVRGVVGGELYLLNYGKIITGNIDPIEKKPVMHYRPGSKIFSIATTGCSWLCRYCFAPDTSIITDQGIRTMEQLFASSDQEGEVCFPRDEIRVLTHEGNFRSVSKVFRHPYEGPLKVIRPFYLPEIRCTPNHNVFVYDETKKCLVKKRADQLSTDDLLAIPKQRDSVVSNSIDASQILESEISLLGQPSLRPSSWSLTERAGRLRFGGAKTAGIPRHIPINEEFAELLGIYCAEGSATRAKNRPNSWDVTFSFGDQEGELIDRTQHLLERIFDVRVARVHQGSKLRLEIGSAPLGVFLHSVAGGTKYSKRVPSFLLNHSSSKILARFLEGYIAGDGTVTGSGKSRWVGTTSVSREMTLGVWYMLLRLHLLPRFYFSKNKKEYTIQGREVNRHYDYMTRLV